MSKILNKTFKEIEDRQEEINESQSNLSTTKVIDNSDDSDDEDNNKLNKKILILLIVIIALIATIIIYYNHTSSKVSSYEDFSSSSSEQNQQDEYESYTVYQEDQTANINAIIKLLNENYGIPLDAKYEVCYLSDDSYDLTFQDNDFYCLIKIEDNVPKIVYHAKISEMGD